MTQGTVFAYYLGVGEHEAKEAKAMFDPEDFEGYEEWSDDLEEVDRRFQEFEQSEALNFG